MAEEEIGALRRHNEHLEQMRRDKDTLFFQLMELTSEQTDKLSPKQRRRIYQKLGLVVTTRADGTLDICGELMDLSFGNLEVTQSSTAT